MRRILGIEALVEPLRGSTVTIGKFFAVHRGHQALIQATVAAARDSGGPAVVLTFDRHPLEILKPGTELPQIASLEERLNLIEAQGADATLVVTLTPEFLALEPEAFVRELLVERLGAVTVLASGNFRFGHRARGDVNLLREMGAELGFEYRSVTPILAGGERISSSRIAACVEAGRVREAADLLGRPYNVPGTVVQGDQVGRELGFPTANIAHPPRRLLPAHGVYVVDLRTPAARLPGICNLGVRPTVDGTRQVLEVHVLDWDGDLYGHEVDVEFLERLRAEQRFSSLEALQCQIAQDVAAARSRHAAR
jgi:riboflavin kinase/FMN adenylyltransferase